MRQVRSILGIIAVVFGIYTREALYAVALAWAIVCDDIVIFCELPYLFTPILGSHAKSFHSVF